MIGKVNLDEMVNSVPELFSYLEVGRLNSHVLTVLQAENRTLDFHVHEQSDEMFYCIDGEFDIEFTDGIMHLSKGDFVIVPKGVSHRPICKELVKCLLIEKAGTLTNENTGGTYDDPDELTKNMNRLRITELGAERIKKNLGLTVSDIVSWSVQIIKHADSISRKGKNWYVQTGGVIITINARSYTIITAHKAKGIKR